MINATTTEPAPANKGFSGTQVTLIALGTALVTIALCYWLYRTYIAPVDFQPIQLTVPEQRQLDAKLEQLGIDPEALLPDAERGQPAKTPQAQAPQTAERLEPEKYEESAEKRDIFMSERELNALVANNEDLAKRFAIDLSDDLASAKLLIPMDPDFPVLGGKTLRVNAGLEVAYRDAQPIVKLRGVSIMGVPVPNAWLGNLKNVDLVQEFGGGPGFWSSFAAGVNLIEISDGQLHLKLKE